MRCKIVLMFLVLMSSLILSNEFTDKRMNDEELMTLACEIGGTDHSKIIKSEDYRLVRLDYQNCSIGYFALSSDYSRPLGYNGITEVGILLDSSYEIIKITLISSEDTRSFVRKLKRRSFLDQFVGINQDSNVKTVTGATITSKAVIKSVKESIKLIKSIY